jgi:hypothetical protein
MTDMTYDEACELLASLRGRTVVDIGVEEDDETGTHIIVLCFDDKRELAVMWEDDDIAFVVDETDVAPEQ